MKTSNKLLIAVTILIIGYLVVYNFSLKAAYLKGDYKSRFYEMERINLKDFNAIESNVANVFKVQVEQGPEFGIWVDKYARDDIFFTKKGKTLQVNYKPKKDYGNLGKIIIICPALDSITTTKGDLNKYTLWDAMTIVSGFNQPLMKVRVSYFAKLWLLRNTLTQLNAHVEGIQESSNVETDTGWGDYGLSIAKSNHIKIANLEAKGSGKGRIKLYKPEIDKINYSLSDSAEVTLSGKLLHTLKP